MVASEASGWKQRMAGLFGGKKVLIVPLENNLFWKQMRVGDTPHSGRLEFEFPSLEVGKTM